MGGVYVQAPPQADGSVPPYVPLTMDMLSGTDESIIQLLQQGIQQGSCIVCSMVVAVQVPPLRSSVHTEWTRYTLIGHTPPLLILPDAK